ncbi:MAG: hypothetical protein WCP28_14190 [Actinomycetes bacterium]
MIAVTALVWVGDCHFAHERPGSVAADAELVKAGRTVVVADLNQARAVLLAVGAPEQTIEYRLLRARQRVERGLCD